MPPDSPRPLISDPVRD